MATSKWDYKVVSVLFASITPANMESALKAQGQLGYDVIFMQVVGTNLLVVMKRRLVL